MFYGIRKVYKNKEELYLNEITVKESRNMK